MLLRTAIALTCNAVASTAPYASDLTKYCALTYDDDLCGCSAPLTVSCVAEIHRLQAVALQKLGVYFDVDQPPLAPVKSWQSMDEYEWDAMFLPYRHTGVCPYCMHVRCTLACNTNTSAARPITTQVP